MNLMRGDCLELMQTIPDNSIDCVLTDPPYGTTACKWDTVIPFEPMWEQLKRITKDNGAICLFGSEPFSSQLRMSNIRMFKYDWIWDKKQSGNPFLAKKQPLKVTETVSVFYSKNRYFPQMVKGKMRTKGGGEKSQLFGNTDKTKNDLYYPKNVLEFSNCSKKKDKLHPTQKPVKLLEYLIKTYTLENETVLDFTMGSGSTGVAAKNLNRKFIGIEKDEKYYNIATDRINGIQQESGNETDQTD